MVATVRVAASATQTASKGDVVPEPSVPVADQVLDCRGLACPLPVVKTAQAIKALALGQVLEVLATDPGVEPDMRAWSSRTHNELLGITKQAEVFHILLRRAH
jgi:tRNA 2-thiouridine synthesizing protein A